MKHIRISLVVALLAGNTQGLRAQSDSLHSTGSDIPVVITSNLSASRLLNASPAKPLNTTLAASLSGSLMQDTIPRRRASIQYSEGYGTRATIHRRLSYAMLPLFAVSYFSGDELLEDGFTASGVIKNVHRGSATAVSVLFAANTVTGGINLWQSRHDPAMRKRKLLHAALFTAATAGFAYAGAVLADQAETSLSKRQAHRNLNLISMGISSASVLVMMVGPNR